MKKHPSTEGEKAVTTHTLSSPGKEEHQGRRQSDCKNWVRCQFLKAVFLILPSPHAPCNLISSGWHP